MAVAPTIEPEDRSMPPVMMTWVTPIAMMPTIETCRMMTCQPLLIEKRVDIGAGVEQEAVADDEAAQNFEAATMSSSATNTLSSGGRARFEASYFRPPTPWVACATFILHRWTRLAPVSQLTAYTRARCWHL